MPLVKKDIVYESIITIYAGKLLDFSITEQVFRVCHRAKNPMIEIILIDLTRTCKIMDSGLAMLDVLDNRTKHLVRAINFVNYTHMIRKFLMDEYFNCSSRELVR